MEKPTGPYTQSMETGPVDPNRQYAISKQMAQSSPHRALDRDPSEQGYIGNQLRDLEVARQYASGYRIDSRNTTRPQRTEYASMTINPPAEVLKAGGSNG